MGPAPKEEAVEDLDAGTKSVSISQSESRLLAGLLLRVSKSSRPEFLEANGVLKFDGGILGKELDILGVERVGGFLRRVLFAVHRGQDGCICAGKGW